MTRIKASDIEIPAAEFMHEPRCHRPRLDADPCVAAGMLAHRLLDLIR